MAENIILKKNPKIEFQLLDNGVPMLPDTESIKEANVIIHLKKTKLGVWLTDSYMADKAKMLKELLNKKTNYHNL